MHENTVMAPHLLRSMAVLSYTINQPTYIAYL